MAVFFDLDEDDDLQSQPRWRRIASSAPSEHDQLCPADKLRQSDGRPAVAAGKSPDEENKLAAAITCYPIALSLACHLDLNDLDALAATCRPVHQGLRQFAHQLKAHSLRCSRDGTSMAQSTIAHEDDVFQTQEPVIDISIYTQLPTLPIHPHAVPTGNTPGDILHRTTSPLGVSTKIGACARDLVGECRSCGAVICRNCTIKPPTSAWLKDRHRRLCKTCLDAPCRAHLKPLSPTSDCYDSQVRSSASSVKSERSFSSSSSSSNRSKPEDGESDHDYDASFTASAFLRDPCTCQSRGVFLCTDCGQNLRAADTTYKRVWTWRSRYSTHIGGGLGTGLGQGNQGQKCGRGENCLDGSGRAVCWVEIDCAEGTGREGVREQDQGTFGHVGSPDYTNKEPGYFQQEMEGIGGVVKKKVKKKVKVGATVWEFEDERASGKYLDREARGVLRSWCGWCGRVCLGEEDRQRFLDQSV